MDPAIFAEAFLEISQGQYPYRPGPAMGIQDFADSYILFRHILRQFQL
jgi:hypothetical protein